MFAATSTVLFEFIICAHSSSRRFQFRVGGECIYYQRLVDLLLLSQATIFAESPDAQRQHIVHSQHFNPIEITPLAIEREKSEVGLSLWARVEGKARKISAGCNERSEIDPFQFQSQSKFIFINRANFLWTHTNVYQYLSVLRFLHARKYKFQIKQS